MMKECFYYRTYYEKEESNKSTWYFNVYVYL
jgi:hypothetical protein